MSEIEREQLDLSTFLPELRQSLIPFEMCLGRIIRAGNGALLDDVVMILSGLMQEANKQFELYNHRGAGGGILQ